MRELSPWAGDATEAVLAPLLAGTPALAANDGVVPVRSQLWGTLAWAGLGDHLDVLGHYRDDRDLETVEPALRHVDWLTSGSGFSHRDFAGLMDVIAAGMLAA